MVNRSALILDIFAQHAKCKEGQAQVEVNHSLHEGRGLHRLRSATSRARPAAGSARTAAVGGHGPSASQIETDRRRMDTRSPSCAASSRT